MIKLINIGKEYVTGQKVKVKALNNINLEFAACGFVAVIGKSGSGKTTLLNLIGALDKPTTGEIYFDGKNIADMKNTEYDFFRSYETGFIFQDYNLLNDYSVIENIKLAVKFQEKDKNIVEKRARKALERVGLSDIGGRKISELSGGQQQRVAIARALAKESPVIFCDEPTGNLDSKTSDEIINVLKDISKEKAVIIVTHDEDIAKNYADRIIKMKDGEVAEDITLSAVVSEPVKKAEKKYHHIGFKNAALLAADNLRKSKISAIGIFILLVTAFTLFSDFYGLSRYDAQDAFVKTLRNNDFYVFQVTKYNQRVINTPNGMIGNSALYYEDVKKEDIGVLKQKVDDKADFYPTYYFNKLFKDFYGGNIEYKDNYFNLTSFREAVEIDDFSTFYQPLLYGEKPRNDNEVLIYDFMAYNLLEYRIFTGITMEQMVGKELTDGHTGLNMKISGILKSNYAQYSYVTDGKDYYDFERTYFATLQTVYCKPAFITELQNETNYLSLLQTGFYNRYDEEIASAGNIERIKFYDELPDVHYTETAADADSMVGIIITENQLSTMLGIDKSTLTPEIRQGIFDQYSIILRMYNYDQSLDVSTISSFGVRIIGITDDEPENEDTLLFYNKRDIVNQNGSFRQIYISLGKDWNVNKKVLDLFVIEEKSGEFYEQNHYYEDYTDYTVYSILVIEADSYMQSVKDFAYKIVVVVAVAGIAGIFLFTFSSVKKNRYKLGVLKSLGARNIDNSMIFGFEMIVLAAAAFAVSILPSLLLMKGINLDFAERINSGIIFFGVSPTDFILTFAVSMLFVVLSAAVPLVKLYLTQPISIIKSENRK
ncbi:MAG: ABC transporter ATP-binding protein/permease [Clostridiales bacterium]|jgi:ABC-type lipoprotein export system ATPase subunit/ABC-type antimicrobial peptide transport system permease subunit|nr:ABC transporter ATP-binding protein/permease [Clostridiales bacterium]